MGLGELYQADTDRAIAAMIAAPQEPPAPPSKWNAWSAPLRAVPAAAADALAAGAETATAVVRATLAARDAPRWAGQTSAEREAADLQAVQGVSGRTALSDALRDAAEHYSPDPVTAGRAEQLVFGLTRGVGKALGYGLTMGPMGVAAFAGDEGLAEVDRLQRQGVDDATAHQAGVATTLATGAGALLPVAPLAQGSTAANVAKVAALGAVSGPAAFAAQQQMTRDILSRAGYDKIAEQSDPLDPWGLATAAVVPWIFGGLSLRGGTKAARRPPPESPGAPPRPSQAEGVGEAAARAEAPLVPREAVDAAMVHNLTLLRDRAGQMPPEPGLSAAERSVEDTFRSQVLNDPDAALRAYAELPDTAGGKIVNTDEARELSADYAASRDSRALLARAVHGPASYIARLQWDRLLAEPPKTGEVLILGGGGGSGKTSSLHEVMPGFVDRFDAIYDTTLANPRKAGEVIEQALSTGRKVTISFTARDPFDAIANGVIPRAQKKGRTVPLDIAAQAHVEAPQTFAALAAKYADDPRVTLKLVDNTGPAGSARESPLGAFPRFDYNDLEGRAMSEALRAFKEGAIDETVFRGLTGGREGEGGAQAGRGVRPEGPGNSGVGGQPEPQHGAGSAGARGAQAPTGTAEGGLTAAAVAPEGAGLPTLAELTRASANASTLAAAVERAGAGAAGLLREAERLLTQAQTSTPELGARYRLMAQMLRERAAVADPDGLVRLVTDRVATVEASTPDLVVRHDENGQPVTVAEEMARVRREAAEGTDAELGALDADLLRVAAECALTRGTA